MNGVKEFCGKPILVYSIEAALESGCFEEVMVSTDDEEIADDAEEVILKAYEENPDAGLIAFSLIRKDYDKTYPERKSNLGFKQILRTSSQQITFSRRMLEKYGIRFDEKMGSGTGNGGGEENKFMLGWRKAGADMIYCPDVIREKANGSVAMMHATSRTSVGLKGVF